MYFTKIITHAGTHHADEVLAIATVKHFHNPGIEVIRIMVNQENAEQIEAYKADPTCLVLDIGREYNPALGNFDHHQDGSIPATNILVLDHFCPDDIVRGELKKRLFNYVDKVDRGQIVEDGKTPTFNSIIRNFNGIEETRKEVFKEVDGGWMQGYEVVTGFDRALSYAEETLRAVFHTAKQVEKSTRIYEACEKQNGILINRTKDFIVNWRELAERDGILLAITPNIWQEGSFQLTSRDTEILKIPTNENQTFLHANQFTASYGNFDSCLNHAKEIIAGL